MDIQVWIADPEYGREDSIIFEGPLYDAHSEIESFMNYRIFQVEVDDQGMLYIGIESPNSY